MQTGPKGEKRPADVIGNAVKRIFNSDGPSVGRKSLILLDRAGDFVKM